MEASIRRPFEGVSNIIRFNWHFYVIAGAVISLLLSLLILVSAELRWIIYAATALVFLTTFISLGVSYYVYDYSPLYRFKWFKQFAINDGMRIVNINAGFDETSLIISRKYPRVDLAVFDFYDPLRHTEISIERARKAYSVYPGTRQISTSHIPVDDNTVDFVFNIFSIHEIRDREERVHFLTQQYRIMKVEGRCVVVEHARDMANFLAYNIGFFHFFSLREWTSTFSFAGFDVERSFKITPFVSVFILKKKNGNTP
jgi:ubiquinone/menaquinone biosynthesis C-methylase UbiE